MATFTIKQYDLAPSITNILTDGAGNPVDLSGATVWFHMEDRSVSPPIVRINALATVDQTGVNPNFVNQGQVHYDWAVPDTYSIGVFYAEWRVIFSNGKPETFPDNDDILINIQRNLVVQDRLRDWAVRINMSRWG